MIRRGRELIQRLLYAKHAGLEVTLQDVRREVLDEFIDARDDTASGKPAGVA